MLFQIIYKLNHLRVFIIIGGVIFSMILCLDCARQESSAFKEEQSLANILGLYLAVDGNCLHSYKFANNAGLLHCDRTARIMCDVEKKLDEKGRIIVTSDTRNRYIAEWKLWSDQYSTCEFSATSATLLPAFAVTAVDKYSEVRSKNSLSTINICEGNITNQVDSLISRHEHLLIASSRGQLALQAHRISESACENSLLYLQSEIQLIGDIAANTRYTQTSCRFGNQASILLPGIADCTSAEEDQAYRFDF